ncbi:uncharacterized protein [Chironomus tepperi]|uniref:uncharacterized protein n=1 Tax=Chironomus tepperi TaxID=113505 RepID=UPI00391F8661
MYKKRVKKNVEVKKAIDKYHCAIFSFGIRVINATWIVKKCSENSFDVYYPAENIPNAIYESQSKHEIAKWKHAIAEIACTHDTIIEAKNHLKKVLDSKKDQETSSSVDTNDSEEELRDLEEDARLSSKSKHSEIKIKKDNPHLKSPEPSLVNDVIEITQRNEGKNQSNITNEEIDQIVDINGVKKILKYFNNKINHAEDIFREDKIVNTRMTVKHEHNEMLKKVATIDEFQSFMSNIVEDKDKKKELIKSWKNLKTAGKQKDNNAKAYAILLNLFEINFLFSNVKWGKMTKKAEINASGSENQDDNVHTLYLKTQDEFNDIVKEVLGIPLLKETNKTVGEIFKNLFNNKIKRVKLEKGA